MAISKGRTNANTLDSLSPLGAGIGTFLGTPTSANLAAALTDESGTGAAVFGSSPTVTTPNLIGTTAAGNVPAGSAGEFISSTIAQGAAVPLTTTVSANVTSISLTAGDWDVDGNVGFTFGAGTSVTILRGGINTVSATQPAIDAAGIISTAANVMPNDTSVKCATTRINVNTTTTVYLVASATFTVSTCNAYGRISARRRV